MPDFDPAGPATLPPLPARAVPTGAPGAGWLRGQALLAQEAACRLLRRPLPSAQRDVALGGGMRFPLQRGSFLGALVPMVVLSALVDLPLAHLLLHGRFQGAQQALVHVLVTLGSLWMLAWGIGLRSSVRSIAHRLRPHELVLAVGFGTECRLPLSAIRDAHLLPRATDTDWREERGLRKSDVVTIAALDEPTLLIELRPGLARDGARLARWGREKPLPGWVAVYVDQPSALREALRRAIAQARPAVGDR